MCNVAKTCVQVYVHYTWNISVVQIVHLAGLTSERSTGSATGAATGTDLSILAFSFILFMLLYFPSPCLVAGLCALQNALQAPCCTRIACPWSHRGWRHWTLMVLKVLSGCWQLAVVLRAHNFTSLPHWIHSQAAVLPWAEKLERSHQNSGAQWSCAVLCQENIDQPGGMALVESKAHWTVLAFKGGSASNTHKSCPDSAQAHEVPWCWVPVHHGD